MVILMVDLWPWGRALDVLVRFGDAEGGDGEGDDGNVRGLTGGERGRQMRFIEGIGEGRERSIDAKVTDMTLV